MSELENNINKFKENINIFQLSSDSFKTHIIKNDEKFEKFKDDLDNDLMKLSEEL